MCEGHQYLGGDADLGNEEEFVDFLNKSSRFFYANWKILNVEVQGKLSQCVLSMLLRKHNLEADIKITGNTSKDISPS